MSERQSFGSKLGIVLATAGSAVGLGNVWRFPYMTGQNGGAAFLLLYVVCIILLGIPGMLSEFIIGRHAQANAARAYDKLSRGRPWRLVGYLGILTSIIILGFYAVVAGWCLHYLFASLWSFVTAPAIGASDSAGLLSREYFAEFSSDPARPVLLGVGFILITHLVIVRGVRRGIEKASKWLMPVLFVLLLVLVVASCSLPGAVEGIRFLLMPDLSKLSRGVLLEALGQAFFSLSLGTACLLTYASYFSHDTNLLRSAGQIALIDTLIALLAGLMIFPAAAAVGIRPDSGPSLIFITLPNVFQQAFGGIPLLGQVVSAMFYALLVFAALTSTISMHEIGTAFFSEEFALSRHRSAWVTTAISSLLCVLCAWSVGAFTEIRLMGRPLMDFCDQLTANVMLPLGAMLSCVFVGWYIPRRVVYEEFTNDGLQNRRLFRLFVFFVRFVCPLCILLIFLHQSGIL